MGFFKKIFGQKSAGDEVPADFTLQEKGSYQSFNELLEQHIIFSLQKQKALQRIVAGMPWNVDAESGVIYFGHELAFPAQSIGFFNHEDDSWKWAWAEARHPMAVKMMPIAFALKQQGAKNGIAALNTPHFFTDKEIVRGIGLIASGFSPLAALHSISYGRGQMLLVVETNRIATTPVVKSVINQISDFAANSPLNHRNAILNYFIDLSLPVNTTEDSIQAALAGKIIKAVFDKNNRLKSVR